MILPRSRKEKQSNAFFLSTRPALKMRSHSFLSFDRLLRGGAGLFIFLFCVIPSCRPAFAEIPESQAIRAIIGESSNQGYVGMLAVAEAIRNRGHLKGVYGLKSPHVDNEPQWVFNLAKKAWGESKTTNLVKGADHWENIKAFGVPPWAKTMTKTVTIKDHAFYKRGAK